jgi:hypothetical protein
VFVKFTTLLFVVVALSRLLPGPDRQVPGYRPRPLRATLKYAGGIAVAGALVAAWAVVAPHVIRPSAPQASRSAKAPAPAPTMIHQPLRVGVFAPGVATSYAPAQEFAQATGAAPSILLAYSALTAPFNTGFARLALAHGATPFIQVMPGTVTMQAVAAGAEDAQ